VMSMRGSAPAEAYGLFPMGAGGEKAEFAFAEPTSADVDRVGSIVAGENAEMSHGGGTKSEMLGETSSGSRAMGRDQRQGGMVFVKGAVRYLLSQVNVATGNVMGEVRHLVDTNYSGVKKYPRIVCSRIDPDEGLRALERLVPAVREGIIPNHRDTRKQVTTRVGIELPDEAFDEEPEPQSSNPFNRDGRSASDRDDDGTAPPRRRPEDRGEREMAAVAQFESREEFEARIAPLLECEGGAADSGGRFPDSTGERGSGAGRG